MNTAAWARFLTYVDTSTECWNWTGGNVRGYGRFYLDGKSVGAHRAAYQQLVGPIPEGLDLDHLCRNHSCVNPAHLEPVTRRENTYRGIGVTAINARATHCLRGHEFTARNTYRPQPNARHCRTCKAQRAASRVGAR